MSWVKLFIGYKTRTVDHIEKLTPKFSAPSNYVDEKKIKAAIDERKQAFLTEAKHQPYTGTFESVCVIDPRHENCIIQEFSASKPPVSVRVRNYLLEKYEHSWHDEDWYRALHDKIKNQKHLVHQNKMKSEDMTVMPPRVMLIGFEVRTFLKILGLECSLPEINKPCPLRMWYGNSNHRDIGEAVMPKECKNMTLDIVVRRRRPAGKLGEHWDTILEGWNGPGESPHKDALLALELAAQLKLTSE